MSDFVQIDSVSCNIDTVITACTVVIMMLGLLTYLKIIAVGEEAHRANQFYPPAFFLGDIDKQRIRHVAPFTNLAAADAEVSPSSEINLTTAWQTLRDVVLKFESGCNTASRDTLQMIAQRVKTSL
jgi:hypothetical protein